MEQVFDVSYALCYAVIDMKRDTEKPFTEVTLPSGSSLCKEVQVQVLLPAPKT